jgi:hypothetical protein
MHNPLFFPSFHGTAQLHKPEMKESNSVEYDLFFYLLLRVIMKALGRGWQLTSLLSWMPTAFFVGWTFKA